MRWVIGDIHGCLKPLEKLLAKMKFDPDRDELWSAGDLVGRGPDPLGVIRLLREVGGRAVMGNHEIGALMTWAGLRDRRPDSLAPLLDDPDAGKWIRWMAKLPILAHLPGEDGAPDAWLVHGGIHPAWRKLKKVAKRLNSIDREPKRLRKRKPLRNGIWMHDEELFFAVFARCCTKEGKLSRFTGLPENCPKPYRPWDEFYAGDARVVHGHWAMRGYYRNGNVIGLDTGCVYGGKLTAWCQEEDRIVQVSGL